MTASYAVPVRQASDLPAASFRFHLAVDTLAVRLTVPPIRSVEDLHFQVGAPCRAHQRKAQGRVNYLGLVTVPYLSSARGNMAGLTGFELEISLRDRGTLLNDKILGEL